MRGEIYKIFSWLLSVFVLVETKWFYEIINLTTVITGNVQLTSAENEGRSELELFLKIQKSHCRTGSISSSCGRLTSLVKKYRYWTSTEVRRAWNNNNLRQVFAILQPEQYWLHTPYG